MLSLIEISHNDGLCVDGDVEFGGLVGAGKTLDRATSHLEGDSFLLGGTLQNDSCSALALEPVLQSSIVSVEIHLLEKVTNIVFMDSCSVHG